MDAPNTFPPQHSPGSLPGYHPYNAGSPPPQHSYVDPYAQRSDFAAIPSEYPPETPNRSMGRRAKKVVNYDDDQYMPDASTHQVPDTPAMLKTLKTESHGQSPAALTGIEVKTKFPVARIKRIMQADEDVGKVAQVTPVVVSKALELFMISLVTKAATEAKSKGSKRVTALHLKQAVTKEPKFDFLSEIVGRVADAPAPSEKNEDDGDAPEGGKKKRGGGRKKRKDSEDL